MASKRCSFGFDVGLDWIDRDEELSTGELASSYIVDMILHKI